jgi:hypothetical protein
MKNKPWVCFFIAIISVVLLAGCVGEDSGGVGVVESVDKGQEEELIGNDEEEIENESTDTPQQMNDTHEYKGITFIGEYRMTTGQNTDEYKVFFINNDFLLSGGGLNIYDVAYNVALAFVTEDNESIAQYLSDHDSWSGWSIPKLQPDMSILNFKHLQLYRATTSNYIDYISVMFHAFYNLFNSTEDGVSVYIGMNIFLNDENEWKIEFISVS